jgi:hypothetical protein
VGVGETSFPVVCFDQGRKLCRVDSIADAGQVTRFVMPPELTFRQVSNFLEKLIKDSPRVPLLTIDQ